MQPASDKAPSSSNALRWWGPLALIVVILFGIALAITLAAGGDDDDSASSATTTAKSDKVGAPEPTGRMPVTYLEAKKAGTLDDYEWSDGCDPDTGKVKAPSVY